MKIGFLGAGNMGCSIIQGLLNSKKYHKEDIKIVVSSNSSVEKYQKENFLVSQEWRSLVDCDVVILALVPNKIKELKEQLVALFSKSKQIIISVAAGISLAYLQTIFASAAVTRVMPNTSCQFNQSMSLITQEGSMQANKVAAEIFNLLGKTVVLSEEKMHVFIAICGSASAYLYHWLQPLMQLALEQNISLEDSKSIIANLLVGVATNIEHSSASLAELQSQVTVPGGTTVEAIKIFEQKHVQHTIDQAIKAVEKRSQELE